MNKCALHGEKGASFFLCLLRHREVAEGCFHARAYTDGCLRERHASGSIYKKHWIALMSADRTWRPRAGCCVHKKNAHTLPLAPGDAK